MSGNQGLSIKDREPIIFENTSSRGFSRGNEVNCHLAEETAFIQKGYKSVYKFRIQMLIASRDVEKKIIKLIRYENNERLGSDSFSDQNDHRNSNLSINRPTFKIVNN